MHFQDETEADTRANRIDPVLREAGWGVVEGSQIKREVICPGRIQSGGRRGKGLSCDYVLLFKGHKLATIEAKRAGISHREGIGQAKDYAKRLDTPMAFASNGNNWYQINMLNGQEGELKGGFPSPQELWDMKFASTNEWRDRFADVPFEDDGGKWQPRYYITRAIEAALESISNGNRRILLTLATGTGKTSIAFHISWKLFQSKWNLSGEPQRRPRILFLADRNILADQAFNTFSAFPKGSVVRIDPSSIRKKGGVPKNASVFFTIFQTFTTGDYTLAYQQYRPDFFDFIIIDECHRGGARDESQWRSILEHFEPAVQLGLTATPKRTHNVDTYDYFGEPVYQYSLKEGIQDGYLTPFKVRQMASTIDEYVYSPEDKLVAGEVNDGQRFTEDEMNRRVIIPEREESRVKELLSEIDQSQKAIVFCATQAHAAMVRDFINQHKMTGDVDYCHRVTADDGEVGEQHLRDFQDNDKLIPTVLTTSQKLSTGVDARNIRHIVLMRPIRSMIEFKQIIGRGTRVHDGKDYFTIWDFVKAHENFEDEAWDGEPIPPEGGRRQGTGSDEPRPEPPEGPDGPTIIDPPDEPSEKIIISLSDGTKRSIRYIKASIYLDADGNTMSAQQFIERLFGSLNGLVDSEEALRRVWSNPDTRQKFLEQLEDRGFDGGQLSEVKALVDASDSDLFDVLAYIQFSANPKTRIERADGVSVDDEAKEMGQFLKHILQAYIENGEAELASDSLGSFMEVRYGSVSEGSQKLGDIPSIKSKFVGLQTQIYKN